MCNVNFKNNLLKSKHVTESHNMSFLQYSIEYEDFKIPKCIICDSKAKQRRGTKFYKTCCSDFCKSKIQKSKKLTDSTREKISKSRKKFLKENPDKHVWKRNNKYISIPCENVKSILLNNNIKFEEEVSVSTKRNYSVDILIPSKNLILEINGNQHYDKGGNLKTYYLDRHNFIKTLGFNIIEIPYYDTFDKNKILKLVNEHDNKSTILPFFKKKDAKPKYGSIEEYQKSRKKQNTEKAKNLIENLLKSNIDFSKQGWVGKASAVIGISPQKVNKWMKNYMLDFYTERCFKRK